MSKFLVCSINERGLEVIQRALDEHMKNPPLPKAAHYYAAVAEQNQELDGVCQFEIRAVDTWHRRPQLVTLAADCFRVFELED
jgi:hypothetical protein